MEVQFISQDRPDSETIFVYPIFFHSIILGLSALLHSHVINFIDTVFLCSTNKC